MFSCALVLGFMVTNVFAQIYTETTSSHRVYYRDGYQGPGSYSTHYSVFDAGNSIYATVAGYVDGKPTIAMDSSGTTAPRVAEAIGWFNGNSHTHNHGNY